MKPQEEYRGYYNKISHLVDSELNMRDHLFYIIYNYLLPVLGGIFGFAILILVLVGAAYARAGRLAPFSWDLLIIFGIIAIISFLLYASHKTYYDSTEGLRHNRYSEIIRQNGLIDQKKVDDKKMLDIKEVVLDNGMAAVNAPYGSTEYQDKKNAILKKFEDSNIDEDYYLAPILKEPGGAIGKWLFTHKHQWKRTANGKLDDYAFTFNGPDGEAWHGYQCKICKMQLPTDKASHDYLFANTCKPHFVCPNCHEEHAGLDYMKFCPYCGMRLSGSENEK